MSWFSLSMSFFLLWWLVFFLLLPIGVEVQSVPEKGHASSAPKRSYIKQKLWGTTLITLVIVGGLDYFASQPGFSFWQWIQQAGESIMRVVQ